MKKNNYLTKGLLAIAVVLAFAQCAGNTGNSTASNNQAAGNEVTSPKGLKIAYVEIDSLLTKYNFWKDLAEQMMKKEENVRATLNERGRSLEKDAQEFQRKLQNNAFVSRERAEQEHARVSKKEQDLQNLQARLSKELADENQKNSLILRDSINAFMKEYNKDKNYSFILSKTGFDNLLYADEAYNVTQEVIDGLNARYSGNTGK